jgi:thiol:disulfide interchange protein
MRKVMKKSIAQLMLLLLISNPAYRYEIGDTISDEISKKLNLPKGKPVILDFFASWCLSCEIRNTGSAKVH